MALQKSGDAKGSTEAYLAALDMQAKLRSVPAPVGPEARRLPADLYAAIFAYLSEAEVARAGLVSRAWKRLTRDPACVLRLQSCGWWCSVVCLCAPVCLCMCGT